MIDVPVWLADIRPYIVLMMIVIGLHYFSEQYYLQNQVRIAAFLSYVFHAIAILLVVMVLLFVPITTVEMMLYFLFFGIALRRNVLLFLRLRELFSTHKEA